MTARLANRVAMITGASRGQGAATARLFAAHGARVVICDLLDEGAAVAKSIGEQAHFCRLDVASSNDWVAAVDDVATRWGEIDVLVNNAGIFRTGGLLDIDQGEFERTLTINLTGAWLGMKAVVPGMIRKKKGAIVNIASTAAQVPLNGTGAYAASKWGLRGLSRVAALEFGPLGIRVNTILPGAINTVMGNLTDEPVEQVNKYYADQPIPRIGEPDEVAQTSLFLASDDASYLTGAEITVDGGQCAGRYNALLPGSHSAVAEATAHGG